MDSTPDQLDVIVGKPSSRGELIAKIFRLRNRLGEPNPDYIPDGYYDVPIDDLVKECESLQRRIDSQP